MVGIEPNLSAMQLADLSKHLEFTNYLAVKEIKDFVEKNYGVTYTISGLTRLLHRLGFVYKKPKLVPGKLNADLQEEWKLQYKLLRANLQRNEAIYFMDSVHPQYQARARYGWIKKGTVKTLPTNSGWKRMHIIGAINIENQDVIDAAKPKINGDYIVEFLQKVDEETKGKDKVYLILDNAGYHKSRKVKEYLTTSKIELIFLPPYSPNLNPIERLWKFMHGKTTANIYYENFEKFTEKIDEFFKNIGKYKNELKELITDNFQTITLNHFSNPSR